MRDFFLYNNTFTLIIVFVMLGGGTVLAANDDVREGVAEAIYDTEESLVSVDNSFIRTVNLDEFEITPQILSVQEDDDYYYVTYSYQNIEPVNGVWIEVLKEDEMVIEKTRVEGIDLGLFVGEELQELVAAQKSFLAEAQLMEQEAGLQNKVVEVEYAGLVGLFLDDTQETFDGYDPVIEPPERLAVADSDPGVVQDVEPDQSDTDAEAETTSPESSGSSSSSQTTSEPSPVTPTDEVATSTTTQSTETTGTATSTDTVATSTEEVSTSTDPVPDPVVTTPPADTVPPVITLVGDSGITLEVGEVYVDPGVTAEDDIDGDITASVLLTGAVDTSLAGEYTLEYSVADLAGNQASASRKVTVLEPVSEEPAVEPEIPAESEAETSSST